MPRKILWLVAILALSLGLVANADTIFMATRPYKGPVLNQDGRLLLPLTQYVKGMELKAHQSGQSWCLTDQWHPDSICPFTSDSSTTPTLFVNGKAVPDALVQSQGQTWVDARAATTAMAGYYKVDKTLGMVDMGLAYHGTAQARPVVANNSQAASANIVVLHFFAHW